MSHPIDALKILFVLDETLYCCQSSCSVLVKTHRLPTVDESLDYCWPQVVPDIQYDEIGKRFSTPYTFLVLLLHYRRPLTVSVSKGKVTECELIGL